MSDLRRQWQAELTSVWDVARDGLSVYAVKNTDEFERAMVFRLAHELANRLEGGAPPTWLPTGAWRVDVELNRRSKDLRAAPKLGAGESPDVVVHERGSSGVNLLAIECKPSETVEDSAKDQSKLKALTEPTGALRYQLGLRLRLDVTHGLVETDFEWFANGASMA